MEIPGGINTRIPVGEIMTSRIVLASGQLGDLVVVQCPPWHAHNERGIIWAIQHLVPDDLGVYVYVGELYVPEIEGSQVVMDGAVVGRTHRDVTGTVTRMKIWFDGKLL